MKLSVISPVETSKVAVDDVLAVKTKRRTVSPVKTSKVAVDELAARQALSFSS